MAFEQFKKALAKYDEDFTVGCREQPTEQDLKNLYEDFLKSGKSLRILERLQYESSGWPGKRSSLIIISAKP